MTQPDSDSAKVPFGPWKTFKSFIELDLKAKGVPPQVDHSLFRGKSGTDARQLRAALKFFGLVQGPKEDSTDKLRHLVEAFGTEAWKPAVRSLIASYDPIVKGVDIERGTQAQLDDAFRTNGAVSGSTLKKAVRLYLAAATEAGVSLSSHFVTVRGLVPENGDAPTANTTRTNAPRVKRNRRSGNTASDQTERLAPEGVDVIQPLPGREFRIWIPKDLSQAELDFGMKYLRDYLKLTRSTKGETT